MFIYDMMEELGEIAVHLKHCTGKSVRANPQTILFSISNLTETIKAWEEQTRREIP